MSKFTCKNDTLVLLPFTGLVEGSLIPLFLQLIVKCWLCLCDQPSECLGDTDPGPHVQTLCLLTGWPLSLPCPQFFQHGQTYLHLSQCQFMLLPQHNSNKHRASVTCDPRICVCLALYVSCKTAEFASMEDSLCYILSKSLQINLILLVYVQGASVNITQDSTLYLHSSRAAAIQ